MGWWIYGMGTAVSFTSCNIRTLFSCYQWQPDGNSSSSKSWRKGSGILPVYLEGLKNWIFAFLYQLFSTLSARFHFICVGSNIQLVFVSRIYLWTINYLFIRFLKIVFENTILELLFTYFFSCYFFILVLIWHSNNQYRIIAV